MVSRSGQSSLEFLLLASFIFTALAVGLFFVFDFFDESVDDFKVSRVETLGNSIVDFSRAIEARGEGSRSPFNFEPAFDIVGFHSNPGDDFFDIFYHNGIEVKNLSILTDVDIAFFGNFSFTENIPASISLEVYENNSRPVVIVTPYSRCDAGNITFVSSEEERSSLIDSLNSCSGFNRSSPGENFEWFSNNCFYFDTNKDCSLSSSEITGGVAYLRTLGDKPVDAESSITEIVITPSLVEFNVTEGISQVLTFTANDSVTRDVVINVGVVGGAGVVDSDYTVPSSVTIFDGETSASVVFVAGSDDVVEGQESLSLSLSLEGGEEGGSSNYSLSSSVVRVSIVDNTTVAPQTSQGLTIPTQFTTNNIIGNTATPSLRTTNGLTMDDRNVLNIDVARARDLTTAEREFITASKEGFPGTDLLGATNRVINYNESTHLSSDVVLRLDISENVTDVNNLIFLVIQRNRNLGSSTVSLTDIIVDEYNTVLTVKTGTPTNTRIITQEAALVHHLVPQRQKLIAHFVDDEVRTVFITIKAPSAGTDRFMEMNVLALPSSDGLISGALVTGDSSKVTT